MISGAVMVVLLLLAGCAQKAEKAAVEEKRMPAGTPPAKAPSAPAVEKPQPPETGAEAEERAPVEKPDVAELLKKAQQLSYTYELVETSGNKEVTTSRVWVRGRSWRMEYTSGMEPPFIFPGAVHIYNERGEYYIYNPENNKAVNMTKLLALTGGKLFEIPEDAEVIGEESLDGRECLVLRKGDYTWWVWKEYGIPLKWVSKETTAEVRNLRIEEVPLSMFELPPGTEIVEAGYEEPEISEVKNVSRIDLTLEEFAYQVAGSALGRYIQTYRGGSYSIGGKTYETVLFKSDWDISSAREVAELLQEELKKRGFAVHIDPSFGRYEVVVQKVEIEGKVGNLYFRPLCTQTCGVQVDFEHE